MDSGEIQYAAVEEVIGKTGKSLLLLVLWALAVVRGSHRPSILSQNLQNLSFELFTNVGVFIWQAQEEVLRKLRCNSPVPLAEPWWETWKAQSGRVTSSPFSNLNVKPGDSAERLTILKNFRRLARQRQRAESSWMYALINVFVSALPIK